MYYILYNLLDFSEELVKIDELINTLRKIQQVPDAAKLKRIAEVLDKMDADHDGSVKVEAVLKVSLVDNSFQN